MKESTAIERFKSKINFTPSGCWEWTGHRTPQGYGRFMMLGETLVHRVSYILYNLPIPKSVCVLHKCDNPPCVNPDHLFLGTRDTNNKDRAKKGRTITPNMNLTHCKRGHEFDNENTIMRKSGLRLCRKCRNAKSLERYHKRKNR